ncbi:MAG: methyltransferase [Bryobacterales bacterium]|nr:methyltransferase [Bryobacterales bacterium]
MRAALKIEKLVFGGDGLARHGSRSVFVPFVLPGEHVEAEISASRGRVLRGSEVQVVRRSSERAQPPCPYFSQCGGCHYQHMVPAAAGAHKVEILRETLDRIGRVEWDGPVPVIEAEPFGYRNRTQLHVLHRGRTARLGFHAARSHRVVAADACAINSPKLNAVQHLLQGMASARRFPRSLRVIEIFSDEEHVQLNLPRRSGPLPSRFWRRCEAELGVGRPGIPLDYRCGDDIFRVSGRSFFQVNRHLVTDLGSVAAAGVGGKLAIDLYAGVGLLTLPLARRFEEVLAVDSSNAAMRDLRFNARRAGVKVRAVQMNVEAFLEGYSRRPDLIVADPPRTGLGTRVVKHIVRLAPARIQLLSCDPATLARDLSGLAAHGYALTALTLVDLFPQTYHIETLASLHRS